MQPMTLDTLASGAVSELFDEELARVLANLADPNMSSAARTITLQVTFKPNRERDAADISIVCTAKLAGVLPVDTKVFIGKQHGKWIAVEHDPKQSELFDQDGPKAVPFEKRGEGEGA